MKKSVYFIATLRENTSLGYDMRPDFAGHTRGTRDLEKVRSWYHDLLKQDPSLEGGLFIVSTPTFVLDPSAELTEVSVTRPLLKAA